MRLCRCGAIVRGVCDVCSKGVTVGQRTTAERGYDHRWRLLSERKRTESPLCEVCQKDGMVTPATEVHHIVPIARAPQLRLVWSNLVSVCKACHEKIEGDETYQRHNE